jgi:hypothetical protein
MMNVSKLLNANESTFSNFGFSVLSPDEVSMPSMLSKARSGSMTNA